jgi:hypothetical protein
MTTTTDPDRDFEDEVRAMLQRRAAHIHSSRTPVGLVVRLDGAGAQDQHSRRRVLRIAAAAVLVAGAAGLALLATFGRHTDTRPGTATAGPPVVIWPLSDDVPPDQLATPEAAARSYLAEVAGLGPNVPLSRTNVRGTEATVHYTLEGIAATVSLAQRHGRWYATGAANEMVVIDRVTPPEGNEIHVDVKPGSATAPVERLRARLVDRTGQVYDTADVEFEDGERVEGADPPLADGLWQTYLYVGTSTEPVAVRVDIVDPGTGDRVLAHASVPVPGAADATGLGAAIPATTEGPRPTVDPDPEPLPPGPDRLPALATGDAGAVGTGSRLGLAGWQDAATALINTVMDTASPSGPPVFSDVSQDAEELTVRGRYVVPDGDAGTFELVRLENGQWGVTSLRSDALAVVEVGSTGTHIQVTLVSAKDADLGVGGFRVGLEPGEPYISAGREAVFSVRCRATRTGPVATLQLFLDAHDGPNIRIFEAWPC